ncbi:LAETG motif-containing sortase-dependent surface protein [Streptomyces sp. DSM 40750]|uniref:LAETG motif-containing sortase-dependent surface protein n=1 Tax=Streptomyces sp. DSM 40750 TaxID=2801030 RepID=UPI00214AB7AE|nr:LAETG motif-containing sortase-dependent surface protein [Streptomyces sp. DSM 40750]UUU25215.1 LPXTG cell wall anchor domain-containing protein [Streptomyces sp. DSM 40750]
MSISPRIARTVRCLGVASASAALVLGVTGNALACDIKDFSAVAECDGDKGVIRVTDVDPLGVKAEVTVYLENNGADLRKVGTRVIENSTAEGVTVTFEEDWKANAEYRIHVTAEKYVDEDLPILVAPAERCKKADTPPAASKSPEEPAEDEPSEVTKTPSTSESKNSAPVTTGDEDNNIPSPEGDSNLAETGSDSNTGTVAGIAAALVALGAGAVYYSMRRRGASTR